MLIGNRYSSNKLYRGLCHENQLPLTSEDLHESDDILQMKRSYILNNMLGSGTLNAPSLTISDTGISLQEPIVLLVDGDISLIQSDSDIVSISDISEASFSDGLICIIGWYQKLDASSTLRAYGGVKNSILTNDIKDENLNVTVSTRYQLRWDTVIVDKTTFYSTDSIQIPIAVRDATGSTIPGTSTITAERVDSSSALRIANIPSHMTSYASSDLYILPIIQYTYVSASVTNASAVKPLKPKGAIGSLIKKSSEPQGDIEEGTIWYNTSNEKLKIYVTGVGFVPTASDYTLLQYRNTVTITTDRDTPTNVRLSIGIDSYTTEDLLQVIYNGVTLTETIHYTLHSDTKEISLLGFTTKQEDQITFIVTKLVETSKISSITTEFNTHVALVGDSTNKGHVNLSDTASSTEDSTKGIAATPKALYDATTIIDNITNKRYRLSVSNGVLGIEEIS